MIPIIVRKCKLKSQNRKIIRFNWITSGLYDKSLRVAQLYMNLRFLLNQFCGSCVVTLRYGRFSVFRFDFSNARYKENNWLVDY